MGPDAATREISKLMESRDTDTTNFLKAPSTSQPPKIPFDLVARHFVSTSDRQTERFKEGTELLSAF